MNIIQAILIRERLKFSEVPGFVLDVFCTLGLHLFFLAFYVAVCMFFQSYAPLFALGVAAVFYTLLMRVHSVSRRRFQACVEDIKSRMEKFCHPPGEFFSYDRDLAEPRFQKLVKAGKYKEALPLLLDGVDNSDPQAMYLLACMYAQGQTVPQSMSQAVLLLEASADLDYAKAQTLLGVYYGDGKHVPPDLYKATDLLTKAARQGEPRALHLLNKLTASNLTPSSDSCH
jgi:hypothetical protein